MLLPSSEEILHLHLPITADEAFVHLHYHLTRLFYKAQVYQPLYIIKQFASHVLHNICLEHTLTEANTLKVKLYIHKEIGKEASLKAEWLSLKP